MKVEGTVQISIQDFDALREKAKCFDELRRELRLCSKVDHKEVSKDEWIQIINIDASNIGKIAVEYSDVEEVYEDDEINLINIEKLAPAATEANNRNISMTGIKVDPKEFTVLLDVSSVVNEIGDPEAIKPAFSSKVDVDDRF